MRKPRVNPKQLDLWTYEMGGIYNALEGEIIRIITKRLNSGHENLLSWQAQKLSELGLFNDDVTRLLAETTNLSSTRITEIFEDTGMGAVNSIDKVVNQDTLPMSNDIDLIMEGYREQAWTDLDNYVHQTLITTQYGVGTAQRAYTKVLNETQAMFNTGMYTFEQSLERSVRELAHQGISSGLTDRRGHTWNLEGYVRTTLKSTLNRTYNEVRTSRMGEYGIYTVLVTSHAGARAKCSKIQGNVVDLRPMSQLPPDSKYRSIYDPYWEADYLSPGGHHGVNCGHLHIPFIDGVNTNNQTKYNDKENKEIAKHRSTQRRIEREIVKYKKSLMVADSMGNQANVDYYKMMVGRRQKAMRKHLDTNGSHLRRQYEREKVYVPLETLLAN